MRVQQIAGALTLSVAVAAIGLIAAAPAAAEERREVETRVKITSVEDDLVKGEVFSPEAGCRNVRRVKLVHHPGADPFFTLSGGHGSRGRTFYLDLGDQKYDRVRVTRSPSHPNGRFICKGDRSRRFTVPPPSEAGIAPAPASAAEDRKEDLPSGFSPHVRERVKSRVKINSIRKRGDAWLVEGVVRSRVNGCERGRLMELKTGRGREWRHDVRDTDRTDRRGRFTLHGTEIRRLASIRATSALSKPNRRVECISDISRRFTIPHRPKPARGRGPAGPTSRSASRHRQPVLGVGRPARLGHLRRLVDRIGGRVYQMYTSVSEAAG
jgi:hypothetical protein